MTEEQRRALKQALTSLKYQYTPTPSLNIHNPQDEDTQPTEAITHFEDEINDD